MIQRIQSVFLLLAALLFGALFLLPLAQCSELTTPYFDDGVYKIDDHLALGVLAGLAVLLSLISLFAYKSRSLQLRLGYFTIAVAIVILLTAYLLLSQSGASFGGPQPVKILLGAFIPVAAIVLLWLANMNIRKDERLVKSMDRLR